MHRFDYETMQALVEFQMLAKRGYGINSGDRGWAIPGTELTQKNVVLGVYENT